MTSVARIDEQIRRARRESGFSQEALAERIGVAPAELSRYEEGERVSSRQLELIAVATGKPVSFFFDQAGSAEQNGTGLGRRLRAALAWVSAPAAADNDAGKLLAEVAARESALAEQERRLARQTAALEARERALQALEAQLEARPAVGEQGAPGINLDALEHALDERAGDFPEREQEWRMYIVFLREFVHADGELPATFNTLVREVFSELLASSGAD